MENENMVKTYSDCYLYNKYPQYNQILAEAIMCPKFIDKGLDNFKDVIYEVKRTKISSGLVRVLMSDKTVLIRPSKPLPKVFVAFVAKDLRSKTKERKLFIDSTQAIIEKNGEYHVNDSLLISYLINGWFTMNYTMRGSKAVTSTMLKHAGFCYASMVTYILDYIGKITVVSTAKDKCMYMAARYFYQGLVGLSEDRARDLARVLVGYSDAKESTMDSLSRTKEEQYTQIKEFIPLMRDTFKIDKLTLDVFVEKWMYLFGPGTIFSLEYLPAFFATITDAYVGGYINNQKTIEKVCGKSMVQLSKSIIDAIV